MKIILEYEMNTSKIQLSTCILKDDLGVERQYLLYYLKDIGFHFQKFNISEKLKMCYDNVMFT